MRLNTVFARKADEETLKDNFCFIASVVVGFSLGATVFGKAVK